MLINGKQIARVFPRRTRATPDDSLAFVNCPPPMLAMPEIDEVHISVVLTWDKPVAEDLAEQWRVVGVPVKVGGPAYGERSGEFEPGLYLKKGYTITSRGCPNHCWFCSVPGREGALRELVIKDGWNVLDDNLLACSDEHITAVFDMLARQKEPVKFSGGLEAARLKPWHCKELKRLKIQRLFFAYDTPDDLDPLIQAGKMLRAAGINLYNDQQAYVLVGYEKDSFDAAERRIYQTMEAGFMPYVMLYKDEKGTVKPEWRQFMDNWDRPKIVGKIMNKIRHGVRVI